MQQNGQGVRARRTRKLLRQALIELIEQRGFDRVTVAELTERALISRAAFYRNYRDKFHLAEEIFDEALGELVATMADEAEPPLDRWTRFFEHVGEYHRFYGVLLGRKGDPWFAERMRGRLSEMVESQVASLEVV
ncbi:MAG TPA: TetR/AcrR family transcriptional regulator [Streptomyces sp.]